MGAAEERGEGEAVDPKGAKRREEKRWVENGGRRGKRNLV